MVKTNKTKAGTVHPLEDAMMEMQTGQASECGHAAKQDLRHYKELNAGEPEMARDLEFTKLKKEQ